MTYIDPTTKKAVVLAGSLGEQNLQANKLGLDYVPTNTTVPTDKPPATTADATTQINSEQTTDYNTATSKTEPATRTSAQNYTDIYNQITTSLTKDLPTKPTTPDLSKTFTDLRASQGVTDLENSLTDLQKQARDITAASAARTSAEQGKAVPMNVITGRISEEQQQDNQRLLTVNNQIQTVTSQLQTKYNVIDSLMKYTGTDYSNSVDAYNKKFNDNLSVLNATKSMVDSANSEANILADNARANAQVIINAMNTNGSSYKDLTASEQTTLTKLGLQAGLGANFFSDVMKFSAGKDILTTVVSDDKTSATIMYKDGTIKKISTGLSASSSKTTEADTTRAVISGMGKDLAGLAGGDGYVSPDDYRAAKKVWVNNGGRTAVSFDEAFKQYAHPESYYLLGLKY